MTACFMELYMRRKANCQKLPLGKSGRQVGVARDVLQFLLHPDVLLIRMHQSLPFVPFQDLSVVLQDHTQVTLLAIMSARRRFQKPGVGFGVR